MQMEHRLADNQRPLLLFSQSSRAFNDAGRLHMGDSTFRYVHGSATQDDVPARWSEGGFSLQSHLGRHTAPDLLTGSPADFSNPRGLTPSSRLGPAPRFRLDSLGGGFPTPSLPATGGLLSSIAGSWERRQQQRQGELEATPSGHVQVGRGRNLLQFQTAALAWDID